MLYKEFKIGTEVRFNSYIMEQVRFANSHEPTELISGNVYLVDDVAVGKFFTKIKLANDPHWYNTAHFTVI
jgi:hypothetical protein